uniref:Lunapark, ER junction formation factor n=1 Tax=Petromyzon marinus TaxID=7757 RepID=S4REG7_PETMA
QAKPSTIQQLETLEKDMTDLEERSERTQRLQRLWIGRLILYSSAAYIVAAAFLWFWSFPKEWTDWVFAALPLLLFPVLVWLLKRFMSWWFVRRTQSNCMYLELLLQQQQKSLAGWL